MIKRLKFMPIAVMVLLVAGFSVPSLAADCSASPKPEINWKRCSMVGQDLSNADLSRADLTDGRFLRAVFTNAKLVGVDAFGAKFNSAILVGADLSQARLQETDFTRADLSRANLTDADLSRAVLFGANLQNAVLTGAKLDSADLENADFSGALWIDGVRRCGTASIGRCGDGPPPNPGAS